MNNPSFFHSHLLAAILLLPVSAFAQDARVVSPRARAVSQPVPINEVQSAAFWVHPTTPDRSLLLITNEKRGLEVHDVGGLLLKHLSDGCHPIYVDVLYDFPLADKRVDLVLASCAAPDVAGVKVWRIDPEKRKLYDLTENAPLKVFDGHAPIGLCTYHSVKTGKCFFFATLRAGAVEQYELTATADSHLKATRVREFRLRSEVKSCIADDETGAVYVAEDDVGIWRFDAEPNAPTTAKCIIRADENGLVPNIKGPAIYHAADGRGYLLAVTQGAKGAHSCVKVYDRQGDNKFILTIDPATEPFGKIDHCSGLAVTNAPTIANFPQGVLALNDQINPNASEDFKLYSWAEIAKAGGLIIDTTWSPRNSHRQH